MIFERVRFECNTCCYAVSGPDGPGLDNLIDTHERENPDHTMRYIDDEDKP